VILKVASEQGWVFYGNVGSISTGFVNWGEVIDSDVYWILYPEEDHPAEKVVLMVDFGNPLLFKIVADGQIYLLNDEGKTIERIN
jgi:hypothetical protein